MRELLKKIFSAITYPQSDLIIQESVSKKETESIFFHDVLDEWLKFHKIEISESTYYGYKMLCPKLIDYFGDTRIVDIDTFYIDTIINSMSGNRMSKTTINNYCKILKMSFDFAYKRGYILDNPMTNGCMPKIPRHTEIQPFTIQEIIQLLKQDCVQWVRDGIIFALHTGMRRGEIYALKWSDINLDQRFIMVQRAQSFTGSKVVIKSTKTACGVRRIDIDKYFATYLGKMQSRSSSEYVFEPPPNSKYPFRVPWNISSYIGKMCISAGIPPRDFHALRHTHATILLAYGIHPKIVQERLGHSDIDITVMTYSHALPTIQKEAVLVFEKVCGQFYGDNIKDVIDSIIDITDLTQSTLNVS